MRTVLKRFRSVAVLFLCLFLLIGSSAQASGSKSKENLVNDIKENESDLKEIQDSLNTAKKEKDELQGALTSANKLIDKLKGSANSLESKIKELEDQIDEIQGNIDELDAQMAATEEVITQTQLELDESIRLQKEQYEGMKLRIQFMYENTNRSYVEMLLEASSIAELLNAVEYIASLSEYDRQMLDQYEQLEVEIAAKKQKLEEQYAELEATQAIALENREALTTLQTARESELKDVTGDLADAKALAAEYEAEVQAQNELIAQIQQAEARKKEEIEAAKKAAAEAGVEYVDKNGSMLDPRYGFLWPCPSSTRVTSDYGQRSSPIKGASTNHKGIDIGCAAGKDIVAAQNGKVIIAAYSSIMGNYVTIDHGDGLYTIYEHASSLCVSPGDYVTRGQVIAKVGSTGISTAPHLHFGVSKNGSYVSPWGYVSK